MAVGYKGNVFILTKAWRCGKHEFTDPAYDFHRTAYAILLAHGRGDDALRRRARAIAAAVRQEDGVGRAVEIVSGIGKFMLATTPGFR